jgi:predicted ATPase
LALEVLSHYRIDRKLGQGGMGEVYLAEDLLLGRKVAIKLLPEATRFQENAIRRFRGEARAISALNHPNIVIIHEIGEDQGQFFIVTELIKGTTLRQIIRQRLELGELLDIAVGIAAALQGAHEAGVIHRDVKPENIMVNEYGVVKLLDFGLAKLTADESHQPETGTVLGTLPYMSPEQIRAELVDERSDIFSLGVILYEMICGRRPFDHGSSDALINAILGSEPDQRCLLMVPAELRRLIVQMLSKSRFERPSSQAVAHQLRAIRTFLNEPAPPAGDDVTLELHRDVPEDAPHNLPPVEGPLYGRDEELRSIRAMLESSDTRLITLTGSGGCGKTRLALEIGHAMRGSFRDGVFFVQLDTVDDLGLVPATIGRAIGIRESEGKSIEDLLLLELRNNTTLLILDNFEHLTEASTFLSILLTASERLKILVTSRAPTRTRWEQEFPLDPLAVPTLSDSFGQLSESPAIRLFVRHATRTTPAFELTEENASAVSEICRALEGLPLAIELAAARVKVLPPRAIAERLSNPLSLLTGGARDLPQRQQTMRATIEWSVRLLTEEEHRYFRLLSIFPGGCGIEAAESIGEGAAEGDVLELLGALVDKSLLRQYLDAEGAVRFAMFETIRSFAAEMLEESGEGEWVRDHHATFYARFAEESDQQLIGPTQAVALKRLESEHANLRAAITWCLRRNDADTALRLAGSLWRFWNLTGRFSEGRALLAKILGSEDGGASRRMRAFYGAGVLADSQGDFEEAQRHFSRMLALAHDEGSEWGIANATNNLGIIALRRGDLTAAESTFERVFQSWSDLGNDLAAALSLQNLGNVAREAEELVLAKRRYEEALAHFRRLGDQRGEAWSLDLIGDIERRRGHLPEAKKLLEESLESFIRINDHWGVASVMADLGNVNREMGELEEARALLEESLLIFREVSDLKSCAAVLDMIAVLSGVCGEYERTLTIAASAVTIRRSIGALAPSDRGSLDDHLIEAREQMGNHAADAAWRRGSELSLEEAIRYAETGSLGL